MSRKFQVKTIPSRWLETGGRRLDCGPYMSGAVEAKEILSKHNTTTLGSLTLRDGNGIFNGPRFPRVYVNDPSNGTPFLGSSDILHADLTNLKLISKKLVEDRPELLIDENWTLISCSGSIGRMMYSRAEMKGMAGSQHFMRVVADQNLISPGYLYAFLSSKFGVPLVISGTYGAIIQHIEPHHISGLPVPRLGRIEDQVHNLISQAADEMSESSSLFISASERLLDEAGLCESPNHQYLEDERRLGWAESSINAFSLRALNYDRRSQDLWESIERIDHDYLGDLVDRQNFEGHIVFTRIDCEPEYGVMLLGQRNAFHLRPEGRWISKKSVEGLGLQVPPGTTVIPCHGTLGESELYCRATLVTERTSSYAYSGDFYRCIPRTDMIEPGYLFAFLRTRLAFRLIRSMSTGSKQQYQHPVRMAKMPIPRLAKDIEHDIAQKVDRASYLKDHSLELEDQARELVEQAIQEGGH